MRRPVVRMSGLSSTTTSRARPTTGTDVFVCPPGSLLRASRPSGSACGTLREVYYWHRETRVSTWDFPPLPPADGLRVPPLGRLPPGVLFIRRERCYIYSDMLENSCGIVSLLLVLLDMLHLGFVSFDCPCPWRFTGAVLGPGAMPVVVASGADGQTARTIVEIPQVQFLDKVVQFPVVGQKRDSHGLPVQKTKYSPVAPQQGDRCPCCTGCADPLYLGSVFAVENQTTDFPGREILRHQHPLVRQWIHVGVSLRGF